MIRQFHRKVLGTFAPEERKFQGANVPWNESSTGVKVLSVDFSLPGTKVQRNEKAWNRKIASVCTECPSMRGQIIILSQHYFSSGTEINTERTQHNFEDFARRILYLSMNYLYYVVVV